MTNTFLNQKFDNGMNEVLSWIAIIRMVSFQDIRGHSRDRFKGGRNSPNVTLRHVLLTFFSIFTHKEFRSLFKELCLLYFVQKLSLIHHASLS